MGSGIVNNCACEKKDKSIEVDFDFDGKIDAALTISTVVKGSPLVKAIEIKNDKFSSLTNKDFSFKEAQTGLGKELWLNCNVAFKGKDPSQVTVYKEGVETNKYAKSIQIIANPKEQAKYGWYPEIYVANPAQNATLHANKIEYYSRKITDDDIDALIYQEIERLIQERVRLSGCKTLKNIIYNGHSDGDMLYFEFNDGIVQPLNAFKVMDIFLKYIDFEGDPTIMFYSAPAKPQA